MNNNNKCTLYYLTHKIHTCTCDLLLVGVVAAALSSSACASSALVIGLVLSDDPFITEVPLVKDFEITDWI